MEKPYRYQKKLLKSGNGHYVLLPATWLDSNFKKEFSKVIVEVYEHEIRIFPVKE
jgi:hypothetical protein